MRTPPVLAALSLVALLTACAGHAPAPASAGFSPPPAEPKGKLTPAPAERARTAPPPAPAPAPPRAAARPDTTATNAAKATGATYVDVLPEPITKVPPTYPDAARNAGISGTVTVEAYVLTDGTVGDTRVIKSVPGLDEAAAASVKQWRFKPATVKGQPVEWWAAPVPVKFSMH